MAFGITAIVRVKNSIALAEAEESPFLVPSRPMHDGDGHGIEKWVAFKSIGGKTLSFPQLFRNHSNAHGKHFTKTIDRLFPVGFPVARLILVISPTSAFRDDRFADRLGSVIHSVKTSLIGQRPIFA